MIILTELDNGSLRVSLDPDVENVKMEIRKLMRESRADRYSGMLLDVWSELLESAGYLGNGWEIADDVFALSTAVCFFYMLDVEDDGSYGDFEKAWYFNDEAIYNPIEIMLAQGFVDYEPVEKDGEDDKDN